MWQTLRRWLVGDPFVIRTSLSDAECKRHISCCGHCNGNGHLFGASKHRSVGLAVMGAAVGLSSDFSLETQQPQWRTFGRLSGPSIGRGGCSGSQRRRSLSISTLTNRLPPYADGQRFTHCGLCPVETYRRQRRTIEGSFREPKRAAPAWRVYVRRSRICCARQV